MVFRTAAQMDSVNTCRVCEGEAVGLFALPQRNPYFSRGVNHGLGSCMGIQSILVDTEGGPQREVKTALGLQSRVRCIRDIDTVVPRKGWLAR